MMKLWIYLLILPVMVACSSTKETVISTPEDTLVADGIITTAYREQGCMFLFKCKDDQGTEVLFRPINLEEKYQKNGTRLRLHYHLSRAFNDGCDLAHPIVIDSVEELSP